jgi:hypothetical protein
MVMVLQFLLGCMTLSTTHGAKTLEPNTWQFGVATSVQQNNPISASVGFPAPQMEISARYGLRQDVDIGTRIYLGGIFTDVRYQFWQNEEWTFAIAPGIGGVGLPVGGIVDFRLPIRAQRSLGPNVDFVTGVVPVSQNTFVLVPDARENYMNNYFGSFVRFQFLLGSLQLGTTLDILDHSSRGIQPSWNVGMDVSFIRK